MDDRGIRKKGVLKKLKRGHKKFFVVREKTVSGPARIEYYDKETAFKNGHAPKRSIELQSCFNISKMSDKKHKYLIKLFTKDDCFSIVYENEEDREEWFSILEVLQNEEGDPSRPHFEHIWPVTVKQKGLGNQSITPGQYRLCLTRHTLSLVHSSTDRTYEFLLGSVRRYGHTNDFFFMEVGRSSQTGPGELWMQAEDSVIARNMHEVLRCFNERSRSENYRSRAHSTASDISHGHIGTGESLLRSGSDASSSPRVHPVRARSTVGTTSSGNNMNFSTRRRRTNSIDSQRSHGTTGSQSDQESDSSLSHLHTGTSVDGHFDEAYMDMYSKVNGEMSNSPSLFLPHILVSNSQTKEDYEEMNPSAEDEYMSMSPPAGENYFQPGTSYSSSPAISTSSSHDIDESYMIMNMSPGLPPLQEGTDAGYMPMTPHGSLTLPGGISHRPDTVRSYFIDDDSNMNSQMREQRAYSLGSKQVYKNKTTNSSGYIPMDMGSKLDKGGTKSSSAPHLVDKVTTGTQTPVSSSSRSSSRATDIDSSFMEMDFNTKNSEPRPRTSSGGRDLRPRTGSFGQEFMRKRASSFGKEANMAKPSRQDGSRYRTTTICQDQFRNRTSSFGNDFRPRSYSDTRHFRHSENSRHSTSDSLRRHATSRTSQESVGSLKMSNEYIDMSKPAPVPEHAVPKNNGSYASMSPNTVQDGYMDMTPGGSSGRSPSRSSEKARRPASRSGSSAGKSLSTQTSHIKVSTSTEKRTSPQPDLFNPGEYIDVDFTSKKTSASSSRSVSPAVKSSSPANFVISGSPVTVPSSTAASKSSAEATHMLIGDSYAVFKPGSDNISSPSVSSGQRSSIGGTSGLESQLEVVFSNIRVEEDEDEPATPTNRAPQKSLPCPKPKSVKSNNAKKTTPPLPPVPPRPVNTTPPRDIREGPSRFSPGRVHQPVPLPPSVNTSVDQSVSTSVSTSVSSSPHPSSQPIPIPLSPNLTHQGASNISAALCDSPQTTLTQDNNVTHGLSSAVLAPKHDQSQEHYSDGELTPRSMSPVSRSDSPQVFSHQPGSRPHVVPFPEIEARRSATYVEIPSGATNAERCGTSTTVTPPVAPFVSPSLSSITSAAHNIKEPSVAKPTNPIQSSIQSTIQQPPAAAPHQSSLRSNRSSSQLVKGSDNYLMMGGPPIPRNSSEASMSTLTSTANSQFSNLRTGEDQLHYASLDLGSSNEYIGSAECIAPVVQRPSTSTNSDSEEDDGVKYSEVDFEKSESLRRSSNLKKLKETQVPFEL